MHVLFTTAATGRPRGGSEFLWLAAAERLATAGVQVTAVVEWEPDIGAGLAAIAAAGGRVINLPPVRPRQPAWWRLAWRFGLVHAADHFAWLDPPARPDLVVFSACLHTDPPTFARVCQTRGIPYALIVQAATALNWPPDDDADIIATAYKGATANWFVSAANRDLVANIIAEDVPRAEIVRNPFNVPYTAAPPWPDSRNGWKLACVARLELQAKAHDVLFAVLAMPKWRDRPLSLTVYGSGHNERTIRRLAARHALNRVQFAGTTADIPDVWATHHALVLPSRAEGLPLAVVEAMLCSRPCIVVDEGGSAELLIDNETGFVAAAASPARLDEALERAWARRTEWQAIGSAAAVAVRQQVPSDPGAVLAERIRALGDTLPGMS